MIKVVSIKREADDKARIVAFADTKAEVTSASVAMEGLPEGTVLAYGSIVYTASGDVAFLKSDNSWNWV